MPHAFNMHVLPTIIAARSGVVQESLRATLTTSARVEVIGSAGEVSTILDLVETRQPALVILENRLVAEGDIGGLLRQLKERQANLQCLVLVETDSQGVQALAAGASAVLLRDDPAERWQETLTRLSERNHTDDRQ